MFSAKILHFFCGRNLQVKSLKELLRLVLPLIFSQCLRSSLRQTRDAMGCPRIGAELNCKKWTPKWMQQNYSVLPKQTLTFWCTRQNKANYIPIDVFPRSPGVGADRWTLTFVGHYDYQNRSHYDGAGEESRTSRKLSSRNVTKHPNSPTHYEGQVSPGGIADLTSFKCLEG